MRLPADEHGIKISLTLASGEHYHQRAAIAQLWFDTKESREENECTRMVFPSSNAKDNESFIVSKAPVASL